MNKVSERTLTFFMRKLIFIFITLLLFDSFLLFYYINLNKNELYYEYSYNIRPIIQKKEDILINNYDINIDNFIDIYTLNEISIKYNFNQNKLNITIYDDTNEYTYNFDYTKYTDYILLSNYDNLIKLNKYKVIYNEDNYLIIKKGESFDYFLYKLISLLPQEEEFYLDLNGFSLNIPNRYTISAFNNDFRKEIIVDVEERDN